MDQRYTIYDQDLEIVGECDTIDEVWARLRALPGGAYTVQDNLACTAFAVATILGSQLVN